MKRKPQKLKPGNMPQANEPIIEVIDSGSNTYLWIGNGAPGDNWCYAMIYGPETLRKLAKQILLQVGPRKRRAGR